MCIRYTAHFTPGSVRTGRCDSPLDVPPKTAEEFVATVMDKCRRWRHMEADKEYEAFKKAGRDVDIKVGHGGTY